MQLRVARWFSLNVPGDRSLCCEQHLFSANVLIILPPARVGGFVDSCQSHRQIQQTRPEPHLLVSLHADSECPAHADSLHPNTLHVHLKTHMYSSLVFMNDPLPSHCTVNSVNE